MTLQLEHKFEPEIGSGVTLIERPSAAKIHVPHIPIILAGYSGSGKDAVSHAAKSLQRDTFQHSQARFTDRPTRPGEIQGDHGHFVTPHEFDTLKREDEFFYDYEKAAYGGTRYGFSLPILRRELQSRHTFIVGGEIDTALQLKKALESVSEEEGIRSGTRNRAEAVFKPLILFVNRPLSAIVKGIEGRAASNLERNERIDHVRKTWEKRPQALDAANGGAEVIWNVSLDAAAKQVVRAVRTRMCGQLKTA